MRKSALLLAVIMMFAFTGCSSNQDEIKNDQEKFLHSRDTYSAELFVEYANTYI